MMMQGATWLHSAKVAENEIEKILKGYYNPVSPTKGKRPEKPKARSILYSHSQRPRHLRGSTSHFEDEEI